MTQEQLTALLRLTLKNRHMLDLVMALLEDMVHVVVGELKSCQKEGCTSSATVKHADLHVDLCDHHAAATIVKMKSQIRRIEHDDLTLVRARLADDDYWIDLPNAERIRRLNEVIHQMENAEADEFDHARYH